MRRVRLYQVYDKVAETIIGPIFAAKADPSAIRSFYDGLRDPQFGVHARDYELLCIGEQGEDGQVLFPGSAPDLKQHEEFQLECWRPIVVATGQQWLVLQEQKEQAQLSLLKKEA